MEALNSLFQLLSLPLTAPSRGDLRFDFRSEILPDSAELLDLAIWLVGTSHVSEESAAEVERVVRRVRPQNVVVELCRSGVEHVFFESGTGFFDAIGRSIHLGGQTALALYSCFWRFSRGKYPQALTALSATSSEKIGARIVLGDRPIEITLVRAWNSLTLTEKVSLVTSVVRGITSPSDMSQKNIKESSGDDSTFQLYDKLSLSYPSLLQPLIHERDTYLAWSLKRSKAVSKSKKSCGSDRKGTHERCDLRFGV